MSHLLLVEDDMEIAEFIIRGLTEEAYEITHASGVAQALEHIAGAPFDLIILDVLLPGGNGFDLCAELRKQGVTCPILMLTAKDTVDDRVHGLDSGADDYLVKPFAYKELLARLRALLRRVRPQGEDGRANMVLTCGDLSLDLISHKAKRGEAIIDLTPREYRLLEFMLRHPGIALSRTQLAEKLWGYNFYYDSNVVDVYIRYLRKKIDKNHEVKLIQTVWGVGYMLGDAQ